MNSSRVNLNTYVEYYRSIVLRVMESVAVRVMKRRLGPLPGRKSNIQYGCFDDGNRELS
jgi:hypothetical protein